MCPEQPFYGAYFPDWLINATLAFPGSVLMRSLLIHLGVDEKTFRCGRWERIRSEPRSEQGALAVFQSVLLLGAGCLGAF